MNLKSIGVEFKVGNWACSAENRLLFVKKSKKVTTRDAAGVETTSEVVSGMPIRVRNIVLTHAVSGDSIKFPYVVRQGVGTFGDSRSNEKSFSGTVKPRYSMA